MEIDIKNIKAAYEHATESEKTLLYILFPDLHLGEEPKDDRPVTERIKTFEDACKELGDNHPFVVAWKSSYQGCENWSDDSDIADLIAYHKLKIITAALNEGWVPQFTQDEWRWCPFFLLRTDEELAEKSDEWRQAHTVIPFDQADEAIKAHCGFAFADSTCAPSNAYADVGSRLCYKSEALAVYSGRQFADLWADFYLIRK